ncbi:ferrochelatase [Tautonia plasticadhaerens]|uniref:Ferrochelatase n=1 Tax=Tautonia plasticadhaerens TaxID=2527974 RepID=A0A518GX15_9BACT|nr:ferrochelatase [Tautonia plasticadhaerens]QDV33112.1 Ferrochelatase [Tautonia plasticadhaerens]
MSHAPTATDPTPAVAGPPVEDLPFDAVLLVSFGGPEGPDDVIPFLENVLRGKPVPRERLLEVAEHYRHFGGVSPINRQCRELIDALRPALKEVGVDLPIYWGNRNWHPMLPDTIRQMADDGIRRALAVVTSSYSSYSGCRQYRENLQSALGGLGDDRAPLINKMRVWYNHPDWIAVNAERVGDALGRIPADRRDSARVAFTAHSIPESMSRNCNYVTQLTETCRLVAEELGIPEGRWSLVYQSRSGRPQDPWLGPDVVDHLEVIRAEGATDAVVHPIGFISDHMEVIFDLDEEAKDACSRIGLNMVRSASVGTHPRFVSMLAELIRERVTASPERRAVGRFGPSHDVCPINCCLLPARPPSSGAG